MPLPVFIPKVGDVVHAHDRPNNVGRVVELTKRAIIVEDALRIHNGHRSRWRYALEELHNGDERLVIYTGELPAEPRPL